MTFGAIYSSHQQIMCPLYINSFNEKYPQESRVTYLFFGSDYITEYNHLQVYNFNDLNITEDIENMTTVIRKLFELEIKVHNK